MRELMHRPLRSRSEVERALGLPCLAEIPVVDLTVDESTGASAHNLCTPVYWKVPEEDGGRFNQAIFVLRQWTQSCSARPARVIVVAATHIGEGCSTIAAQLARYAASTGLRTVLLDADLRARGLSDALDVEPSTSSGESEPGTAAQFPPAIQLQDGLDFCAAAPSNCRPLDVLGSHAMGAFLDKLRDDHELIVIDTPALATYVDAAALVEHADALLLVVKAAQTDQQDVIDALTRLDADPQLPIGVVLNMVG
jgi:Mrp family chromosome partitioning ATPase